MSGYLLPICAMFFSLLLIFVYFSKKRIDLLENKIFSYMIIITCIDGFLVAVLQLFAIEYFSQTIIEVLNKLDFMLLIFYNAGMYLYIYIITKNNSSDNQRKRMMKIVGVIAIIFSIICGVTQIEAIFNGDLVTASGSSVYVLFGSTAIFLAMATVLVLLNTKNVSKKHLPLFCYIILAIGLLVVYIVNPYLIVISITLTFINYIMFFTIENPDVKMINQLELAKTQAEKANNAKSDFLSSMSHEIRTPLNAIVGLSEYINDKENVPEDIKGDLQDIVNASNTLLDIVGNILDINKIENDKLEITNVPYNFKEELRKVAKLNKSRVQEKGLILNVTIAKDLPFELLGDKVHIKSVINNLLTNAVKYTDKGEINVNINCINKDNICTLIISVRDTGRGIKAESINKLFNKFERLDAEKNSTTEGTGLGLAITKRVVEMMGGKINVQSQYGQGSVFIVQLPQTIFKMIDDNPIKEEVKSVSTNTNLTNKNILIVDDSTINIKVAKKLLENNNYNLEEATNGEECIQKVQDTHYDLILMDIMMPLQSGEEVLKILKENKEFSTPVIALTADAVAGAEDKYLKQGFVDYIAKPFNKEQINKVIKDILKD